MIVADGGQMAAKAIVYAKQQLGKPYVWGAMGPDSFDCSGLVASAYMAAGYDFGIDTRPTTYTLVNHGEPVTQDEAGDLVFPSADHVGISLGGGKIIHAPEPGDVVKISQQWVRPWAIRRLAVPATGDVSIDGSVDAKYASNSVAGIFVDPVINQLSLIFNPHTWFRVMLFTTGIVMLGLALFGLDIGSSGAYEVVKNALRQQPQ